MCVSLIHRDILLPGSITTSSLQLINQSSACIISLFTCSIQTDSRLRTSGHVTRCLFKGLLKASLVCLIQYSALHLASVACLLKQKFSTDGSIHTWPSRHVGGKHLSGISAVLLSHLIKKYSGAAYNGSCEVGECMYSVYCALIVNDLELQLSNTAFYLTKRQ